MDGASTSADAGMRARQKRVLPARTRRGGPGLGNCEVDVMILERQKRKRTFDLKIIPCYLIFEPAVEYDPLIPPKTRLLLTTNSCIIEKSSKLELGTNEAANERYFDRPEVVKAYREQQLIQTPDFAEITETPTAMSRLRPRNSEEVRGSSTQSAFPPYFLRSRRQRISQMRHMKKGIANTKHSRSVYDCGRKKSSSMSSTSLKSG
jgi:hypothetical protein